MKKYSFGNHKNQAIAHDTRRQFHANVIGYVGINGRGQISELGAPGTDVWFIIHAVFYVNPEQKYCGSLPDYFLFSPDRKQWLPLNKNSELFKKISERNRRVRCTVQSWERLRGMNQKDLMGLRLRVMDYLGEKDASH